MEQPGERCAQSTQTCDQWGINSALYLGKHRQQNPGQQPLINLAGNTIIQPDHIGEVLAGAAA
jgi:hypothetical protein